MFVVDNMFWEFSLCGIGLLVWLSVTALPEWSRTGITTPEEYGGETYTSHTCNATTRYRSIMTAVGSCTLSKKLKQDILTAGNEGAWVNWPM